MYDNTTTDALGESDQFYRTAWLGLLWCRGWCAAEVGGNELEIPLQRERFEQMIAVLKDTVAMVHAM